MIIMINAQEDVYVYPHVMLGVFYDTWSYGLILVEVRFAVLHLNSNRQIGI